MVTAHKRSSGKVMFSQVFVCQQLVGGLPSHNVMDQAGPSSL